MRSSTGGNATLPPVSPIAIAVFVAIIAAVLAAVVVPVVWFFIVAMNNDED